jgi:RNA polymerase sigma-70 factor (ECF subfamily)
VHLYEVIVSKAKYQALAQVGVDGAFEEVAIRETPRLYALAMTITRSPSEAEDVLQETLLSAWQSWSRLRDPSRRASWLTRICVNKCLSHARSARRGWRLLSASAQEPSPPSAIEFAGELLDFDSAFAHLSPRQRAAFALHVQYGFTVSECAGYMGCRPGTARSHLARAVESLRREMTHA